MDANFVLQQRNNRVSKHNLCRICVLCDKKLKQGKDNLPPQMTIFSTVVHIIMHFVTFSSFKMYYVSLKTNSFCNIKPDVSQQEATAHNEAEYATEYQRINCRNFFTSHQKSHYILMLHCCFTSTVNI